MQSITNSAELREAIRQLEEKKVVEKELLKEEFSLAREKMKPSNVVKSTFEQVFTGPNLVRTVMILSLGISAAYVTKKYFQGLTGRILRKLFGRFLR
ncbi:MAG: hypothetical protein ACM3NR_02295 [Methanosarcina sp.]